MGRACRTHAEASAYKDLVTIYRRGEDNITVDLAGMGCGVDSRGLT